MAKKLRHRIWWLPVFQDDVPKIQSENLVPNESILFDDADVAYGYALSRRMEIDRDGDNNVLTDDAGYAQFKKKGKIVLIGIKGKAIDWKQAQVLEKPADVKGNAIYISYYLPVNKQSMHKVFEEPDDMYNKFASSPLARAGGVEPIATDAAEGVLSTVES